LHDVDDRAGIDVAERALRCGPVESDPAGQLLGEPAEQEVRVRDRRCRATAPVARRTWLRACTLRTDPYRAAGITPHDRAAACTDGLQVDGREMDRQPVDRALARALRVPAGDQADVRGGAAHVERDRVL